MVSQEVFIKYQNTLKFLFNRLPMYQRVGAKAYKADLSRTLALDDHFQHPHLNYKTVHVAGTNGKGSVSHMLSSVLQEGGYKVGLYTSPHLKDFRERIKVNGIPVSQEYVVDFVEKNKALFSRLKPSFFEMTVAMAFDYFKKRKIDIAVVETGLGGRLDSTNIINPLLSVITNIGHDHSEFLGTDLLDIAREKAGIIKSGVPVVIGETQDQISKIFEVAARNNSSELIFADQKYQAEYSLISLDNKQILQIKSEGKLKLNSLQTDLLGIYQGKNIVTSLQSIEILQDKGVEISDKAIFKGLDNVINNTGFYGRWQVLSGNPLIVCDTGHNIEGIREVMKQIMNTPFKRLHFILGLVKEKNPADILSLLPKKAKYYFTEAQIPRALDAKILEISARKTGLRGKVFHTVKDAFNEARQEAELDDMIFVGGSTDVVAEIL